MRDKNRIPIVMQKFQELWLLHPDLRFGQLVYMLAAEIDHADDIFYPEEDEWLNAMEKCIKKSGVDININNQVMVRLTPEGLNILVENIKGRDIYPYENVDEFLIEHYKFNPALMTIEIQLYEFFDIFNKHMYLSKELPFNANIKILKE